MDRLSVLYHDSPPPPPKSSGHPYPPHDDTLSSSVGFSPGNLYKYRAFKVKLTPVLIKIDKSIFLLKKSNGI